MKEQVPRLRASSGTCSIALRHATKQHTHHGCLWWLAMQKAIFLRPLYVPLCWRVPTNINTIVSFVRSVLSFLRSLSSNSCTLHNKKASEQKKTRGCWHGLPRDVVHMRISAPLLWQAVTTFNAFKNYALYASTCARILLSSWQLQQQAWKNPIACLCATLKRGCHFFCFTSWSFLCSPAIDKHVTRSCWISFGGVLCSPLVN